MNATARGMKALDQGDWETAELSFTEILEQNPRDVEANFGMARLALAAGFPEDVQGFTRLPGISDPRLADAEYSALRLLGKPDEAISHALTFLRTTPDAAPFRLRVGTDLLAEHRYAEAIPLFREGGQRDPSDHKMAGGEAAACMSLGRMDETRAAVQRRLKLLPHDPLVFSHWFALHSGVPSATAADLLALGLEWDDRFGKNPDAFQHPALPDIEGTKPRIGFLSSTFHHHANCQFLLPLLEALDRTRFELFAYHDGPGSDDVTALCEKAVDRFRKLHGMPERKAAATIHGDGIDLLIDINAHYDNARPRILTYRPAPVQVHYLGGTTTTGMRSVDWRIADDLNEPLGQDESQIGTERIHRIAGGIHSYRPLRATAAPDSLPALRNGYVTLGCLNSLTKMEDEVLRLWGRCLEAIPEARLRLVKQWFRHEPNRADFTTRAATFGIDPARLELIPGETGSYDDLSVYHGIDIALDTFAYNGITTICEALWMGVPVVTLRGERFVSREASGILTRTGHPEWVAETPDEYVEILRPLAADREKLAATRATLRSDFSNSSVHDPVRLAREMERFFLTALGAETDNE